MPIQSNGSAPYAPPATVLSVIDRARDRGLPSPVTKDVLLRSGVSESLVPRVLQALQLLELINEDGTWTQNLEILRRAPETEVQARLAEIIRAVYADVFQFVDPSKDNPTAIRDQFRSYNPHGQQERMVTLFLGLCQKAGIISRDSAPKTIQREKRVTKKTITPKAQPRGKPSAGNMQGIGATNLAPPIAGLLAALPQGDAGWTQQDRDRFVKAFETMLDYCIPIRGEESEEPEEESP